MLFKLFLNFKGVFCQIYVFIDFIINRVKGDFFFKIRLSDQNLNFFFWYQNGNMVIYII